MANDNWLNGGAIDPDESDFEFESGWPCEVRYSNKEHASNNAHRFLAVRPAQLIVSDAVIYSLDVFNIWREMTDADLMAEIRETDPAIRLDINKIGAMVREIKIARGVSARPFEWINEPANAPKTEDLILCANGILDARTMKLLPHTSDYFATGVPEWSFDPAANSPLWLAKLDQWLELSFHATLQEWFGYCLTPDTSFEKMMALIGASRGGKGTTKGVLERLVGAEHRASIMLNDLAGDFGLESMMDKRLIIMPDVADTNASKRGAALERIKSITGNDSVSVNRKNKSLLHDVRIPAKLTLLGNKHPKFLDDSSALAIRELIITFDKSFKGKEDTTLRQRLGEELSGIANWAIEGLRRLRKQTHFTVGEHGLAAHDELAEMQSHSLRFSRECLDVTGDKRDMVPLAMMFMAYEAWAQSESINVRERRSRDEFKHDLISNLRDKQVRYDNKQMRWRDPHKPRAHGDAERIKAKITGVKLKRSAYPGSLSLFDE